MGTMGPLTQRLTRSCKRASDRRWMACLVAEDTYRETYRRRDVTAVQFWRSVAILAVSRRLITKGMQCRRRGRNKATISAWCPPNCGMVPSGLEEDCVKD